MFDNLNHPKATQGYSPDVAEKESAQRAQNKAQCETVYSRLVQEKQRMLQSLGELEILIGQVASQQIMTTEMFSQIRRYI